MTACDIKISEAILKLSESLRQHYRESDHPRAIISLTVMAWNISLFSKEQQTHVQGMLLDNLPLPLQGGDVAVLSECLDALIESKNRDYPNVREYILTYTLSHSGDSITLTVGTAPVPATIKKRL